MDRAGQAKQSNNKRRVKKQKREGYDEYRLVQVRPGVTKAYSVKTLWPTLARDEDDSEYEEVEDKSEDNAAPLAPVSKMGAPHFADKAPVGKVEVDRSWAEKRAAPLTPVSKEVDRSWAEKRKRGLAQAATIRQELCRHSSCLALDDVIF